MLLLTYKKPGRGKGVGDMGRRREAGGVTLYVVMLLLKINGDFVLLLIFKGVGMLFKRCRGRRG